ncbi:MAG TPA: hypothetical protein VJN70_17110 [Gemmatimonadaceae bacterium]|nr:hypothetical protein [Gemmatimonadaceae bacterium]
MQRVSEHSHTLSRAVRIEPRWPVAVAIIAVLVLLHALPARLWLFPKWASYVAAIGCLVPMTAVSLTAGHARWLRIERIIMEVFFVLTLASALALLRALILAMIYGSGISGLQLLTSSVAVWVINVVAFSLLYWQIDRGGPEARLHHTHPVPDFLFVQAGTSGDLTAWRPTFVDYLFLGYSTATAFSATDVAPLTGRAKLLMMLESAIALATIVVVASRAINILGG